MKINKELIKMLELMNKYPKINRFMWAVLLTQLIWILLTTLPALITAIISWQQLTGK